MDWSGKSVLQSSDLSNIQTHWLRGFCAALIALGHGNATDVQRLVAQTFDIELNRAMAEELLKEIGRAHV